MIQFAFFSVIVGGFIYMNVPNVPILGAPILGAIIVGVAVGMRKLLKMDATTNNFKSPQSLTDKPALASSENTSSTQAKRSSAYFTFQGNNKRFTPNELGYTAVSIAVNSCLEFNTKLTQLAKSTHASEPSIYLSVTEQYQPLFDWSFVALETAVYVSFCKNCLSPTALTMSGIADGVVHGLHAIQNKDGSKLSNDEITFISQRIGYFQSLIRTTPEVKEQGVINFGSELSNDFVNSLCDSLQKHSSQNFSFRVDEQIQLALYLDANIETSLAYLQSNLILHLDK